MPNQYPQQCPLSFRHLHHLHPVCLQHPALAASFNRNSRIALGISKKLLPQNLVLVTAACCAGKGPRHLEPALRAHRPLPQGNSCDSSTSCSLSLGEQAVLNVVRSAFLEIGSCSSACKKQERSQQMWTYHDKSRFRLARDSRN